MTSLYGYITLAELELFAAETYSERSLKYTDAVIEAQISQSERDVNVYCKQSFTITFPDGVVSATLELTKRRMHNRMVFDKIVDAKPQETIIGNDKGLVALLEQFVNTTVDSSTFVDAIPFGRNQYTRNY